MAVAGYNCVFISDIPDHFKCPECKKVLRDPQRVSCCDEEYCKACIEQMLRDNQPCKECGTNNDISISKSRKTKKKIDSLRCHCSNQEEGCNWEGELQELDNHLNENPTNENRLDGCNFTTLCCQYCQEMFPRNEMGEHQENICQQRQFNCEYCDHRDTYECVINNHIPQCPQKPVECPQGCGMSPERQNLTAHKAEECPKTMIKCEIQGCDERRKREEMQLHNQEFSIQHTQLLSQKVRDLEEEAKQRREEQDARHLPITLTMTNFEQHLDAGDQWTSRLFYTHNEGYAVYLTVYADGWMLGSITENISVFVHITRGEYDEQLEWPCRVSIKVSLLNQQQNGESMTKVIVIRAERTAKRHHQGWQRFTKQRSAQQQFVKDNCLKFMVSLANN